MEFSKKIFIFVTEKGSKFNNQITSIMKKTINRKSYNTEYDAEFVCKFVSVIDGWAREQDFLYKKKSTGEYFLYKKWGSWNDSWDIVLVNDKKAAEIIKNVMEDGYRYEFTALMADVKGLRRGQYFWGNKEDDPWDKKMAKLRAEKKRQEKAEQTMKKEEKKAEAAEDKTWSDAHWGETEVYQASAGYKFSKYDGRELSAWKKGKMVYHKVSFRIVNNDYDRKSKDSWGGYKYSASIVLPADDKKVAKETVKKFLDKAVELKGRLDPVMKDGVFIGVSDHNKDVMKTFYGMVDTFNEGMCF